MAGPLRGRGEAGLIKEKITFLELLELEEKKIRRPLSMEGRGGKALMARPEINFFFAASLINYLVISPTIALVYSEFH